MIVREAHLFGDAVSPNAFIQFDKTSRLENLAMPVKRLLAGLQDFRDPGGEDVVQLAGFEPRRNG